MAKFYQCYTYALIKKGFLFFFFLLFVVAAKGKTTINIKTDAGKTVTVPSEGIVFVDSGGENGAYLNEKKSYTVTFYSGADNVPLQLTFTFFDVETASNCRYDYLEIYDGKNTNALKKGKYCGTSLPPEITHSSSR